MNGLRCAILNRTFCDARRSPAVLIRRLPFWLAVLLCLLAPQPGRGAESDDPAELFRTGQYAEAVEAATKGISASEFNEPVRLLKMRAEMALGRYPDAAETLDSALKKFPYSIELRWWGRDVCRFNNQPERAKELEKEIAQAVQQSAWRYGDAGSRIILGRYLLAQGADPKKVLDTAYNIVKKNAPGYLPAYLASGDLALEKNDFALAAQSFRQAVKLAPDDADAHFGLARAFAPSESEKADEELKATLEHNPYHAGALLLAAEELIDGERYDEAEKLLEQVTATNPHHPQAAAFQAVMAHVRNQPAKEQSHRDAALKYWKTNPDVDFTIGRKLSQKYRFAEGAQHQRQALQFDANYLPAKMQLSQDLLRLGQETEGWKLAEEVNSVDGYNVAAHNLVTLQDSIEKFRTMEDDGIALRMETRESEIYGRRVLELLKRAKRDLCAKYDVKLPAPIIVEMFPKQEDFAIRTFGMPGGAGFLGVCFGTVITANSPASQGASPTCWESTLWHEFCHVVTLNKTHNRMPRWLSEGISVYEERQAHPAWGQKITPQSRKMLLGDELTPVDQLSSAFLRPPTAQHLQFAYFESSLVVEFLVEQHGIEALKKILIDLGNGITINEALARHTGSLEELNQSFVKYARNQAEKMAPDADWSEPELPRRIDATQALAWLKEHPKNYSGLQRLVRQLIVAKQWEAAKAPLETMRQLYPNDAGDDSLYPLLARVHHELKETDAERATLEKFAELSDDNADMFERLTELTAQAKDWERTREYALRWLAVNPLNPTPHRKAAQAAEELHDDQLAADSYRALLLLNPVDVADLHLRLSTATQRLGDLAAARRHALLAVEEAPRFRQAHKQLLALQRLTLTKDANSAAGSESADRPNAPALPEDAENVPTPPKGLKK